MIQSLKLLSALLAKRAVMLLIARRGLGMVGVSRRCVRFVNLVDCSSMYLCWSGSTIQ
jgi:hypothetical protein